MTTDLHGMDLGVQGAGLNARGSVPATQRRISGPVIPVPTGTRRSPLRNDESASAELWSSLPRELAEQFRPHIPRIAGEIISEIQRAVPEYAKPLDECVGQVLTEKVQLAVEYCVETIANPQVDRGHWEQVFRHTGKLEFTEGRNMDLLQTAYRVGGRVAWRYISEIARALDVPPDLLSLGAEAIFAYIDELSKLSLEGYSAAEERASGTFQRRRQRLLRLILAQPAVSAEAIADLAEAARWSIPERLVVVALERRSDQHGVDPEVVPEDDAVLIDLEGNDPCLITTDPAQHLPRLQPQLAGWRAVVSPSVPFVEAPTALRWARRALGLRRRGVLPQQRVTWSDRHLSTLWLFADEPLISELARRTLHPFNGLTVNKRARLAETLLTWLETRGSATEIAKILGVHQQTVRYRLHQLEQLFGDRLNNPDDRFDMELVLRAQRMLTRSRPAETQSDATSGAP